MDERKTKNYLKKGQSGNKPGWKSWKVEKAVAEDRNRWSDSVEKVKSVAN